MPASDYEVEDLILNYDPVSPQKRFIERGVKAALLTAAERLPSPVPWPAESAPVAEPLSPPPKETDDLTRFRGYDAVVMTWTAAEAAALASLFVPEYLPSRWYLYRHGVKDYIPLVTGPRAPFNDRRKDMARYYHTLGLYFPCKIGNARVLLLKSGLHLDYDGPKTPLKKLVAEIIHAVQPKLFITTGTGGGIGKEVSLGDVVVAGSTRFYCTTQFKSRSWAKADYDTAPKPPGLTEAMTAKLLSVNAARVAGGRKIPKVWSSSNDAIVTTDFFGFDESTDHYGLQGQGRVCDMGDAMIGQVMRDYPDVKWFAIRNASDPQIKTVKGDIRAAKHEAGQIYARYGVFTTAASVIASWAVIDCATKSAKARPSILSLQRVPVVNPTPAPHYRLGKKPAVVDSRTLRFGTYVRAKLPAPPEHVDWGQHVKGWPMYENDKYGDCTCAAAGHMIQAWTASCGNERTPKDSEVLKFYEHFTPPGPENGCDMLTVLKYWRSHGLGKDRIAAFTQLEPRNTNQVKDAIWLFGACYIGVELPKFALNAPDLLKVPWVVPAQGPVGDGAPDPAGGHCIPAVAYDSRNLYVVTWGAIKPMSWQFYHDYADEAYAILSVDFFNKHHESAS